MENPWLIIAILIWTLPWKGAALWRSARRGHFGWFVVFLLLNTLAVVEIIYLLFFSKKKIQKQGQQDLVMRRAQRMVGNRMVL